MSLTNNLISISMATNVVMPKMGESITEGTVLRWLKKPGDKVEKDEPILEISTDKVDTEVPSQFAGTLSKIVALEKETIAVGKTLAFISGASGQEAKPAEKKSDSVGATGRSPESAEQPKSNGQSPAT